ncbi:MAG: class I SAM-dependent methyltransferase [Methanobacteriota archaeon]|nr:MAG: class I SAM-dependent methyltransferase [Euryarchaeota archaeon]
MAGGRTCSAARKTARTRSGRGRVPPAGRKWPPRTRSTWIAVAPRRHCPPSRRFGSLRCATRNEPPWNRDLAFIRDPLPHPCVSRSKADVRATYDRIAESYAAARVKPWDSVLDFIADLPAGGLVLDVGCGHGRHARSLALTGHRVVGVDLSRRLLSIGRTRRCALRSSITFRPGTIASWRSPRCAACSGPMRKPRSACGPWTIHTSRRPWADGRRRPMSRSHGVYRTERRSLGRIISSRRASWSD